MRAVLLVANLQAVGAFVAPRIQSVRLPHTLSQHTALAESSNLRRHAQELRQEKGIGVGASLLLGVAVGLAAAVMIQQTQAVSAASIERPADVEKGSKIFVGNCAACHAGGSNAVQKLKTLKKEVLENYGMYDIEKIKYQVVNGKNAMPAFGERIPPEDITDVAAYVLDASERGWPREDLPPIRSQQ